MNRNAKYVIGVILGLILALGLTGKLYLEIPKVNFEDIERPRNLSKSEISLAKVNYFPQHYRINKEDLELFKECGILAYGREDPTIDTEWIEEYKYKQRLEELQKIIEGMDVIYLDEVEEIFKEYGFSQDEMMEILVQQGKEIKQSRENENNSETNIN